MTDIGGENGKKEGPKKSLILDNYLTQLRDDIQGFLKKNSNDHLPDFKIGLWTFNYNSNMEHLETLHFIHKEGKPIKTTIEEKVYKAEIPKGYGSIGYSAVSKKPLFVFDTVEDPRGTVLSVDEAIGQGSAICYPIIDKESKEILLILDIFFDLLPKSIGKAGEDNSSKNRTGNALLDKLKEFFQHKKEKEIADFFKEYLELKKSESQKDLLRKGFVDYKKSDLDEINRDTKAKIHKNILLYLKNYGIEFFEEISKQNLSYFNLPLIENILQIRFEWCSLLTSICTDCPFKDMFLGKPDDEKKEDCFFPELFNGGKGVEKYTPESNRFQSPERKAEILFFGLKNENIEVLEQFNKDLREVCDKINKEIDRAEFFPEFKENIERKKKLHERIDEIIESFENEYIEYYKESRESPLLFWCWLVYLKGKSGLFLPDDGQYKGNGGNLSKDIQIPSSYLPLLRSFQSYINNTMTVEALQQRLELYPPSYHASDFSTKIKKSESGDTIVFEVQYDRSDNPQNVVKSINLKEVDWEPFYRKVRIFKEDRFNEFIGKQIKAEDSNKGDKDKLEELLGLERGNVKAEEIIINPEETDDEKGILIEKVTVRLYMPKGISWKEKSEEKEFVKELVRKAEAERTNLVLRKNLHHSALKAAIAGILSRNMSHNIGSHVLQRASIERIEKRMEEKFEDEIRQITIVLKRELDYYLQRKADFSAEIITEPLISTKKVQFIKDVLCNFLNNTLLIDNIAKNEGYEYEDELKNSPIIFYVKKNGISSIDYKFSNHCKNPFYFRHDIENEVSDKISINDETKVLPFTDDITIEVPGPIGEFAFFNIFENLIRNTAKHNKYSGEQLKFYINFNDIEADDDHYEVEIWDNLTKDKKNSFGKKKEGDENIPIKSLKKWIDHYIQSSIIDNKSGEIRNQAWGIAEMKVMANLLRGSKDFSKLEDPNNFRVDVDQDNRLKYVFKAMKSKFLIGFLEQSNFINGKEDLLNNMGIYIYQSLEELKENLMKPGKSPAGIQFALLDLRNNRNEEDLKDILHLLPFRVIKIKSQSDNDGWFNRFKNFVADKLDKFVVPGEEKAADTKKEDPHEFLNELENLLYNKWLSEKWGKEKISISIFCGKDKEDPYGKYWEKSPKKYDNIELNTIYGDVGDGTVNINPERHKGFWAFWDRHGTGYSKKLDNASKNLMETGEDVFYIEIDKKSSDFVLLFSFEPPSPYLLAESALLKILIIDERVSENAAEDIEEGISKSDRRRFFMAKDANIFILTHINNKPLNETRDTKKIKSAFYLNLNKELKLQMKEINNSKEKNPGEMDIVVIHQGILDKLKEKYDIKIPLKEFIKKLEESARIGIIVESGRGIPPELRDKPLNQMKFIPFSILHEFLLNARIAKIRMAELIMRLVRRSFNDKTYGNSNKD